MVPKKNPKGGPFGLPSAFENIKKTCGSVRDSNPRSPASERLKIGWRRS